MDEFDAFGELDLPAEKPVAPANNTENTSNSNGGNKGWNNGSSGFVKRDKITNVVGTNEINLWEGDYVKEKEIDFNNMKSDKKFVTIILPNTDYKLNEDEFKRLGSVAKLLHEKGYALRFLCNGIRNVYKGLSKLFGEDKERFIGITAWKGFCKEMKDITLYTPTDANIQAAAYHVRNFSSLPAPSLKYKKAAAIAILYGTELDRPVDFIITHDRGYEANKKIDYKASGDAVDFYFLARTFTMNVYNLANNGDTADLVEMLKEMRTPSKEEEVKE